MQWLKWTMFAVVGCLPALALADEPAKKDKDDGVKFGLRIEVDTGDNKPKVLHFGNGDSKESENLAKLLSSFGKGIRLQVTATKVGQKPPADAIVPQDLVLKQLTDALARKAMAVTVLAHVSGEKGAFLGVGTSPPPTVLSKQLGLHDGMGLVADEVVPGGPAAKAGLQQYDVLEKFDDQLVINFEQLAVLVHSHKPGDDVKLTVIHEGKPVVLTVKLSEHEMPIRMWQEQEFEINAHIKDVHKDNRVWEIVPDNKK